MSHTYQPGDSVDFLYTTKADPKKDKPARTVRVVGVVKPASGNTRNPNIVCVEPGVDGKPFISCDVSRINMPNWEVVEV
jgi:hypothetical protein